MSLYYCIHFVLMDGLIEKLPLLRICLIFNEKFSNFICHLLFERYFYWIEPQIQYCIKVQISSLINNFIAV